MYLASDELVFATDQLFTVDGGMMMWQLSWYIQRFLTGER
jgi:hypothetical protein